VLFRIITDFADDPQNGTALAFLGANLDIVGKIPTVSLSNQGEQAG
jgi:hypothetical protein